MKKKVAIYAHRGASGYTFENTFEAYEKALKMGADGIELDVQRSKDQQLFVFHDLDLFRLAGIRRLITDCTADELLDVRLGKRFFGMRSKKRIPLFEEVIKWANEKNIPLNIELKESLVGHMQPFIALLRQYALPEGSHVSSFIEELLVEVKQQIPSLETAIIVTKKFDWDALPYMAHIDAVHANKKYYQRPFLKAVEKVNKPIRFYGIDGTEPYLKDPHPSVDAWMTDYPDKVVKIEKSRH